MEILIPVLVVSAIVFAVVALNSRGKKRGNIPGDTTNSGTWGWMFGDSGSSDSSQHHSHHHHGGSHHHSHHHDAGGGHHHGGFDGGGHHGGFDGGGGHGGGHH